MITGLQILENTKKTLEIFDNTKLDTFQSCQRKFMFSYVFNLRRKYANLDLEFGKSVHDGFETLDDLDWKKDGLSEAMSAFKSSYGEHYDPSTWLKKAPKNPSGANAIYKAALSVSHEHETTIMKEIAIPVMLDHKTILWCKMDRLLVDEKLGGLISIDYKTSGRYYEDTKDRATSRTQFKGYTAALEHHFSSKGRVLGVHAIYCMPYKNAVKQPKLKPYYYAHGTSEDKNGHALLIRIPTKYDAYDLEEWRLEMMGRVDHVREEIDKLSFQTSEDKSLTCFRKNTNSCFAYNKACPFFEFCHNDAWAKRNPLFLEDRPNPPIDYKKEVWNPRDETRFILKDGKAVLNTEREKPEPKKEEPARKGVMRSLIGD